MCVRRNLMNKSSRNVIFLVQRVCQMDTHTHKLCNITHTFEKEVTLLGVVHQIGVGGKTQRRGARHALMRKE